MDSAIIQIIILVLWKVRTKIIVTPRMIIKSSLADIQSNLRKCSFRSGAPNCLHDRHACEWNLSSLPLTISFLAEISLHVRWNRKIKKKKKKTRHDWSMHTSTQSWSSLDDLRRIPERNANYFVVSRKEEKKNNTSLLAFVKTMTARHSRSSILVERARDWSRLSWTWNIDYI